MDDEALDQFVRYQEADAKYRGLGAPRLFDTVQVLIATCAQAARYGTILTPERFFLEWRKPYPLPANELEQMLGKKLLPQDIALYSLLSPDNLLDICRNFVAFESDPDTGRTIKKLCRYQQYRAVGNALVRAKTADTPQGRGGAAFRRFSQSLDMVLPDPEGHPYMGDSKWLGKINVKLDENPAFYRSLRERLEQIIEDRKARRIDEAEQLKLLDQLRTEAKNEAGAAEEIGLSGRAFAIYGVLRNEQSLQVADSGDARHKALAEGIEDILAPYTGIVDWQVKEDVQRDIRRLVKRHLTGAGVPDEKVKGLVEAILDLSKARRSE